ncbi:MAG: hypothetical protein AAF926_07375, partial [Pseudomonadota bacterium]
GPHFQIHRFPRKVTGVPITLTGWILFLIYLGGTLSGFLFIADVAQLEQLSWPQFIFIVAILIGFVIAVLLLMMWALGEVVDHRDEDL